MSSCIFFAKLLAIFESVFVPKILERINNRNQFSIASIKYEATILIFVSIFIFIVAALINKQSNIKLKNININPTRDGILRTLTIMGGNIKIYNKKQLLK